MAEQRYTTINNAGDERPMSGLLSQAPRRAILAGVEMPYSNWPIEESLDELAQLASTAGVTCVDTSFNAWLIPIPPPCSAQAKCKRSPNSRSFTIVTR